MNTTKEPNIGVLLMSYGTPQTREDLYDYMTSIRGGHEPTKEEVASLEARYTHIGQWNNKNLRTMTEQQGQILLNLLHGMSQFRRHQINTLQRHTIQEYTDQKRIVQGSSVQNRIIQKLYIGYQHMNPSIEMAISQMKSDGIDVAIAIVTAPFYSIIGTSVYEERALRAANEVGIELRMVREWWQELGFADYWCNSIETVLWERVRPSVTAYPHVYNGTHVADASQAICNPELDVLGQLDVAVVFSAHSLPVAGMDEVLDSYVTSIQRFSFDLANTIQLGDNDAWSQAWQSAGPRGEWLGPSVETVIDTFIAKGYQHILFAPIGFVSDHVEVLYDNDTVCRARVECQGAKYYRAGMPNTNETYINAMARAVEKRIVK